MRVRARARVRVRVRVRIIQPVFKLILRESHSGDEYETLVNLYDR